MGLVAFMAGQSTLAAGSVIAWGANGSGQTDVPPDLTNAIAVAGGNAHSLALKADGTVVTWGSTNSGLARIPAGLTHVVAIAAGNSHSLALKADGTVVCWGQNTFGQTNVPFGLTQVVAIAGGNAHSLALKSNGVVVAWGLNGLGQTNVPLGLSNVIGIAAGGSQSLALRANGTVVAWGRAAWGDSETNVPPGLSSVIAIAAGLDHSLALRSDGTVVAWGYDTRGQLDVPQGLSNAVAITAGRDHSLALNKNDGIVAWGWNGSGQTNVPTAVSNVAGFAAGSAHSLALLGGQPGETPGGPPFIVTQPTTAIRPEGFPTILEVGAGGARPLNYQWRFNGVEIADATNATLRFAPLISAHTGTYSVTISNRFGSINSAAVELSVVEWPLWFLAEAVDATNLLWTSGGDGEWFWQNSVTHDGVDAAQSPEIPRFEEAKLEVKITGPGHLAFWWRIAPGFLDDHQDCLEFYIDGTNQGDEICSGPGVRDWELQTYSVPPGPQTLIWIYYSDLGFPVWLDEVTFAPGRAPVIIEQPSSQARSLGAEVTLTVSAVGDQPLWYQWRKDGVNIVGATNEVYSLSGVQTNQAGSYAVVVSNVAGSVTSSPPAVLSVLPAASGGVVAWGDNADGQTTVRAGLSGVVAIAAGQGYTVALKDDGTVVAWGFDGYGQWTVPAGLSNVVAVAAGAYTTVALKNDGTVVAWGFDGYEWTVPTGLSNVVAIATGGFHTAALKNDGTVVAWGAVQLGLSFVDVTVPAGLSGVRAIAAGHSHTVALKDDGTVVAWGFDSLGQATVPTDLGAVVAIAAGNSHTVALRQHGTVVAWGDNFHGESTVPAGLGKVVAIAAGGFHTVALKSDSTVVAWGWNLYGQTTTPEGLSGVTAISAGENHTVALLGEENSILPVIPNVRPSLTVHPVNRTVIDGDNLEIVVMAVGRGALNYQWQREGTNLVGGTSNRLPFVNAQPEDSGDYRVIVSNALGAVTSRVARLTVLLRPRVQPLPAQMSVAVGETVTLSANATGTPPLRYQWRKNGANLPGAINATFTLTNAQISDGGSYSVVVANDVGIAVSEPTLLVVAVPLPVPDNFVDRLVVTGLTNSISGTNRLTTRETGEPLHAGKRGGKSVWYSWQAPSNGIATFRTVGSTFDTLLGIYTNNASVNPQPAVSNLVAVASDEDRGGFYTSLARFNAVAGTSYYLAVDGFAGADGHFVLGWELEPTAETIPVLTDQPVGQVAAPGANVTFTVGAVGAGLTYQWLFNGAAISGATATSLTLNSVQPANVGFYSVRVRNSVGREVESLPATLEISAHAGPPLSEDKLEDLFPGNGAGGNGGTGGFAPVSAGTFLVSMGSIDYRVVNNTDSATQQREPVHCATIGNATRWLRLRPAADGTFVIDTHGSAIAAVLAVYTTGATAFDYPQVACDDAGTVDGSRVRFSAMANRDYLVVADGANYAEGLIQLNWKFGVPPPPVTNAPGRHRLRPGEGVVLHAPTTGKILPLPHFQWFWNGRPLAGQTNAWLSLSQLQSTNSGYYTVEVDNGIGAVTQTTQVEVEEPILLTVEPRLSQGLLRLHLPAVTNAPAVGGELDFRRGVMIETTSNLGDPFSWRPVYLHTNQMSGTTWETPTTNSLQFFRARRWPYDTSEGSP